MQRKPDYGDQKQYIQHKLNRRKITKKQKLEEIREAQSLQGFRETNGSSSLGQMSRQKR